VYMKKIILLLLLTSSVLGIGLVVPQERQIIFSPNKILELQYGVGNSNSELKNFKITVDAGELQQYVENNEIILTLLANSQQNFKIKMQLPSQLQKGIYPVKVHAEEQSTEGGMKGLAAITDIVKIISSAEQAYPLGNVEVSQNHKEKEDILFAVEITNIGKTKLENFKPIALLKENDDILKTLEMEIINIEPFENKRMMSTIKEYLEPGYYILDVTLGDEKIINKIAVGQPTITAEVSKIKAGEENEIGAEIFLDWNSEIKDIKLDFYVNTLIQTSQIVNLKPGKNELEIKASAGYGKTGEYPGYIKINDKQIKTRADFIVEVEGSKAQTTGFIKTKTEPEQIEAEKIKQIIEEKNLTKEQTETLDKPLIIFFAICAIILIAAILYYFRKEPQP